MAGPFGLRLLGEKTGATLALGALGAVLAVTAATAKIADPDGWWLAVAGRDLLATGHVATINGHAFTAEQTPWIMHEWLLGPLYALGGDHEGPAFFALIALFSFVAALSVGLASTLPNAKNLAASVACALVTFTGCSKRFLSARPTSIALVLAMLVAALAFGKTFDRRRAGLVILLELGWANVHGSFPLGVVLLAAGAIAETVDRRNRLFSAVGAFAVTFVNPYGWRLYGLVAAYLFGDHGGIFDFVHRRIAEFRPLWDDHFRTAGAPECVALIALGALALGSLGGDRGARVRALVCLGLLALAVKNVRHLEQFGLVTFVLLGARVGPADAADAPRFTVKMAFVAIAPGLALGLAAHVASVRRADGWIAPSLGGASIVRLVEALPDHANVHAPFASSALVLWLAAPRGVRVAYDARNDCYPVRVAELADRADDGDRSALRDLGPDHVIAPVTGDLARAAIADGFTIAKTDGDWALLETPTR